MSAFPGADDLLRPAEVAEMFGVRTPTIARWAREGRLVPLLTPGGHRRYSRQEVHRALGAPAQAVQEADNALRDRDGREPAGSPANPRR